VRAVLGWYRRRALGAGWADGHSGAATVVQRFGSGLQLNVHSHALFLDGVFTEAPDGTLRFHPAPPPTGMEGARLVATIRTRVRRRPRARSARRLAALRLHCQVRRLRDFFDVGKSVGGFPPGSLALDGGAIVPIRWQGERL
jgi:hypothetical protein